MSAQDERVPEEDDDVTFESASDSDEENGIDNNQPMEVMMKNFMGATPDDNDREGIENLCKQIFKYFKIDVKNFAELLVEQNYVTTVLKEEVDDVDANADDDPDEAGNVIYGVYSVVNFKSKKGNRSVKQIMDFILTNASKAVDGDLFKEVLDLENPSNPHKPGFIVKEKVVNIPGVAVGPLMKQLLNDLADATAKGMEYDFTHFIHIAKMIRIKNKPDYYVDQDDEIIHKYQMRTFDVEYDSSIDASIVFQNERGNKMHGKAFRRVYIFSTDQMQEYMTELSSLEGVRNVMDEAGSSGLRM